MIVWTEGYVVSPRWFAGSADMATLSLVLRGKPA